MNSDRVFITGGSGFIGANLVAALAGAGAEVLNYDRRPSLDKTTEKLRHEGEILDRNHLSRSVQDFKPDLFVHLAARCDLAGPRIEDYKANTEGVQNVIFAASRAPSLKRIIFTSSRYVHRNGARPANDTDYSPFTIYGASKVEGEKIVRESMLEIPWIIIRPTSIWGPFFGTPYKSFFDAVRKGLYLHPASERIYKSYGYVGNAVYQIQKLLTASIHLINRKVLYLADYEAVEIGAMAEMIRDEFGARPITHLPLALMRLLAWAGDASKKIGLTDPPLTTFRLNNLRSQMVYNVADTETIVGPLPYSVKEGVRRTAAWMKANERREHK